jgi:hypothetical protein
MKTLETLTIDQLIDFREFLGDLHYEISREAFDEVIEIKISDGFKTVFYGNFFEPEWMWSRFAIREVLNYEFEFFYIDLEKISAYEITYEIRVLGNKEEALKHLKEAVGNLKNLVEDRIKIYKNN